MLDLTEHGVFTIQVRGAAIGGIDVLLGGIKSARFWVFHAHLVNKVLHLARTVGASPDDVELGTATATLRIDIVRFTGCCQCSTLVVESVAYFRFQRIAWTTATQHGVGRSTLGIGVAALNYKSLDDTMKQGVIIIALLDQTNEIVAVEGCGVIESHNDVAQRGLYLYPDMPLGDGR